MKLLTREEFKIQVFARDGGKCVCCDQKAIDAHHILDRKLFQDGGYYLDNGASVCEEHHKGCESTIISVEKIRELANIKNKVIPEHFYSDEIYDKWGNIILSNGQRIRGELFDDPGVQINLKNIMNLFIHHVKYPRTYHLPWSLGISNDDKILKDTINFSNNRVIILEKVDGENTSIYNDHIHARSLDSKNHKSRDWVKSYWGKIKYEIPKKWRICGENLYAKHSIYYDNLPSFFMGFSIWNEKNECLSWDDTKEWFSLIGIHHPLIIYDGIYNEELIKKISLDFNKQEGYVIRNANKFTYKDFSKNVAKMVRKNHVATDEHWMHQEIVPNKLSTLKLKL